MKNKYPEAKEGDRPIGAEVEQPFLDLFPEFANIGQDRNISIKSVQEHCVSKQRIKRLLDRKQGLARRMGCFSDIEWLFVELKKELGL